MAFRQPLFKYGRNNTRKKQERATWRKRILLRDPSGDVGAYIQRATATRLLQLRTATQTKVHFSFEWVAVNGHPLFDANFCDSVLGGRQRPPFVRCQLDRFSFGWPLTATLCMMPTSVIQFWVAINGLPLYDANDFEKNLFSIKDGRQRPPFFGLQIHLYMNNIPHAHIHFHYILSFNKGGRHVYTYFSFNSFFNKSGR